MTNPASAMASVPRQVEQPKAIAKMLAARSAVPWIERPAHGSMDG
jgi:hypothetical protein